jgi:hypothetical protein
MLKVILHFHGSNHIDHHYYSLEENMQLQIWYLTERKSESPSLMLPFDLQNLQINI